MKTTKRISYVAIALTLGAAGWSGVASALAQANAGPASIGDPLFLAKQTLGKTPGIAVVGVSQRGAVSISGIEKGEPLDQARLRGATSSLFEIGSITKVFTALLVAQAVERNEVKLDDTLGDLLTGKVTFSSANTSAITLKQVLTHTSCLPNLPPDFRQAGQTEADAWRTYDRGRLWTALGKLDVSQRGPCKANYSNFGYAVLGELMAERAGRPWSDIVRSQITEPLGMKDTVAADDTSGRLATGNAGDKPVPPMAFAAFAGAGALRSNAEDMLVFGRALIAGRNGPLGPAAERMVAPLGWFNGEIGYGIRIRGPEWHRTWTHNGGTVGQQSVLIIAPDTKEVWVVFATNSQAPLYDLYRTVMTARYPVTQQQGGHSAPVSDYAGVYTLTDAEPLYIAAQNGTLYMRRRGELFTPLLPAGPDRFTLGNEAELRFNRSAGAVKGIGIYRLGVSDAGSRTDARPITAKLSEDAAQQYTGTYRVGPTVFRVSARDGQLFVRLDEQAEYPVFASPDASDQFVYDVVPATLQFERRKNGTIDAVVLRQEKTIRARKIK